MGASSWVQAQSFCQGTCGSDRTPCHRLRCWQGLVGFPARLERWPQMRSTGLGRRLPLLVHLQQNLVRKDVCPHRGALETNITTLHVPSRSQGSPPTCPGISQESGKESACPRHPECGASLYAAVRRGDEFLDFLESFTQISSYDAPTRASVPFR